MGRFFVVHFLLIIGGFAEYATEFIISSHDCEANFTKLGEKFFQQKEIFQEWVEVPLDHFNILDDRTWKMKFYFDPQFLQTQGHIFIEIGGEWKVSSARALIGPMHELAKKHSGLVIASEHRYYGDSLPFGNNFTTENMRYLQIEQALEDLAFIIDKIKMFTPSLTKSLVIVHGCSYAGMLARLLRLRFPHLVDIAYASSAPAWLEMTYSGYHEVINDVYANFSQECRDTIKDGFEEMQSLLTINPEEVRNALRNWSCGSPDNMSGNKLKSTIRKLIDVQHDPVGYENSSCYILSANKDELGPFQRLANFAVFKSNDLRRCGSPSYRNPIVLKSWAYQVCTEIGSFATYNRTNPHIAYDTDRTAEEAYRICNKMFGNEMNTDILQAGIANGHRRYGKGLPVVPRIISTVGMNDPWNRLGYPDVSNPESPVFTLKGSHCTDLVHNENDPKDVQEDRKKVIDLVSEWIDELTQKNI